MIQVRIGNTKFIWTSSPFYRTTFPLYLQHHLRKASEVKRRWKFLRDHCLLNFLWLHNCYESWNISSVHVWEKIFRKLCTLIKSEKRLGQKVITRNINWQWLCNSRPWKVQKGHFWTGCSKWSAVFWRWNQEDVCSHRSMCSLAPESKTWKFTRMMFGWFLILELVPLVL